MASCEDLILLKLAAGRAIDLADVQERSIEGHDVVVHGFTHRTEMKLRGETLIVNPGEACGWLHGTPQCAIVDLITREVEFLSLTEPSWKK